MVMYGGPELNIVKLYESKPIIKINMKHNALSVSEKRGIIKKVDNELHVIHT
jgi:hypothetical protein